MTASYNESRLDDVIFVISANVKSFEENEHSSFIKNMNDGNYNKKGGREELKNDSKKEFRIEKMRIVKNLSAMKSIALLEYNCCSGIGVDRNSLLKGSAETDFQYDYYVHHHPNFVNDSSTQNPIMEDIT